MVRLLSIVSILAAYVVGIGYADEDERTRHSICDPNAGSIYQFTVGTLDGQNVTLDRYKGFTPQYLDFNTLASKYSNLGLFIVGFPCNQFLLQEPGQNNEILNGIKYVRPGNGYTPASNVHIYGKLEVNGRAAHPLYNFLKKACPPHGDVIGDIKNRFYDEIHVSDIVWNFEKFIIDREGRPRYRFHPDAWDHGAFVEQFMKGVFNGNNNSSAVQQTGKVTWNTEQGPLGSFAKIP